MVSIRNINIVNFDDLKVPFGIHCNQIGQDKIALLDVEECVCISFYPHLQISEKSEIIESKIKNGQFNKLSIRDVIESLINNKYMSPGNYLYIGDYTFTGDIYILVNTIMSKSFMECFTQQPQEQQVLASSLNSSSLNLSSQNNSYGIQNININVDDKTDDILPLLENWSVALSPIDNPYIAPELLESCIYGKIYNDIRFSDGTYIHTSKIKVLDIQNKKAETKNTVYKLGNPSKDFIDWLTNKEHKLEDYQYPINYLDGIKIEETTLFEIECYDLEKLIKRVYGKELGIADDLETGNDTCRKFHISSKPLDDYDSKKLNEFINTGRYSYLTRILLIDMCNKKIIKQGEYLIIICW